MQNSIKIQNLNKFTKSLAKDVCYHLDLTTKELKYYMSVTQAKSLVKEFCVKSDEDESYSITRENCKNCATEMQNWIIGFEVARMASDGSFESYVHEDGTIENETKGEDDDLA